MKQSETIDRISAAICAVQKNMPTIVADSENHYLSTAAKKVVFADLNSIWKKIREVLASHDVAIIQGVQNPIFDGAYSTLQTRLQHPSGQFLEDDGVPLIASKTKQGDVTMQQMGSAITYARRQGLTAMIGVTVAGEDDDAHQATVKGLEAREKTPAKPLNVQKFTGPLKTMAALKTACKELSEKIIACKTIDDLDALRGSTATNELITQLKADLPLAWDQDSDDFKGIKQRFDAKKADL